MMLEQQELQSQNKDKKRDAVKKVIANMTIGKDVSMLFTDVVNCIQTANVELKKLVYLYIINYAKSNPDLALLAVNTFCKDAHDANPLIRALAVRTMGMLHWPCFMMMSLARPCNIFSCAVSSWLVY